MPPLAGRKSKPVMALDSRGVAQYAAELLVIGIAYYALARLGLELGTVDRNTTPIWPPTGLALGVVLLRGLRIWPAIFLGALIANATSEIAAGSNAGLMLTASAIAAGDTLEAVLGGYLTIIWTGGRTAFDTPSGIAKFALLGLGPGTMISATVGVGSLSIAGYADLANFETASFRWWLGDVASALVITPVIVLWLTAKFRAFNIRKFLDSSIAAVVATGVGLIAFSPLIEQTAFLNPLSFLAILVEVRLRQQEQILRGMFSRAAVGIAQVDTEGRFKLINDRFCEIVRRSSRELAQLRLQDIVDPDDLSPMLDLFRAYLKIA